MKYYYLFVSLKSYPATVRANIAISEDLKSFLLRNGNECMNPKVWINFAMEIDFAQYCKLQPLNPSNESYFKLQKKDYGKYLKEGQ